MDEIWVDIKGYENKYQISNIGRVKSLNYNNSGKEQILKPKINRYGYNEIKLSKNNKTKNYLIHTLVAKHFLIQPSSDMIAIHLDKNNDDGVQNLAYGYKSEMLHLMYKKGHRKVGKPSGNIISYKGKQYKKFGDMARDNGLTLNQLYKRLERGWRLDESLDIPLLKNYEKTHVQLYEYEGKLYSIKDLSKISGISERTIYKRIKRGWNIYEVVEIPTWERGKLITNIK